MVQGFVTSVPISKTVSFYKNTAYFDGHCGAVYLLNYSFVSFAPNSRVYFVDNNAQDNRGGAIFSDQSTI